MKKKIDVSDLRPGMYVRELDRPWLDTPFLFQGFMLESEKDVEEVRRICKYVYIDTELSLEEVSVTLKPTPVTVKTEPAHEKPAVVSYTDQSSFEEEIPRACLLRDKAKHMVDNLYEDVRLGRSIDVAGAKAVVGEVVDSIIRNPDAQSLLTQLKKKDEYTSIHSMNVCIMSLTFGRHIGLPRPDLLELGLGALMHDLGKMKVPNEILNKPAKLTPEETLIMRKHPEYGREILLHAQEEIPKRSIDVAYTHHERMDGQGYPEGLPGDAIPLFGRMVAVVDFYDAVTSNRVYHDGESSATAMSDIYDARRGRFDKVIVEDFIQCLGIYPIGSIVDLSSGEVGIIVALNRERRLRPKVLLVLDRNKKHYATPKIFDLALFDKNDYQIVHIDNPNAYNIDVRKYIMNFYNSAA